MKMMKIVFIFNVGGEFAQFRVESDLLNASALQPCKHHTSYLGLLRSRPDPIRRGMVEQDKTSTAKQKAFNPLPYSLL